MKTNNLNSLPPAGFMRLPQVLEVFPVSKSNWWAGVKTQRYPAGVKLSPKTTAWRVSDIQELLDSVGEGK
jgi:prophage regulatory protein